ncbi:PREDICTED: angiotensin-converting enzyme-like [Nicrophorus vespilloides]|uniref:Angiotensin-converting enzyme n=1 Tax=Nicrophorus vespilloides TaxID=110193 RepID=A0ABM1N5D7_NICVS|nr:PREDICTED: angiotensin-converting enzyme-like [Nicrophorus vespilloides]
MGICWQVFLVIGCISVAKSNALPKTPEELEDFLYDEYEKKASKIFYDQALADWNYATDITNKNSDLVTEQTLITAKFEKDVFNEWFKDAKLDEFKNESVKRQLKFLKIVGDAALDETELTKYTKVMNNMTETYSTAKICPFKKQKCDIDKEGLSLEPGIESIMSKSNDVDELLYFWTKWRNATGTQLVSPFKVYVNYSKKIGERNGFNDKGAMWRGSYDYESDEEFMNSMDKLWKEVEPLYNKLHGYVRQKLVKKYGKEVMGDDDLIPAHLLGNMWGQSWINLADLTRPYPSASKIDVTKALQEQKYTVEKMFEKSNEFYMSLGLPTNEMSYGKDAMIEKPKDKEVLCHASAWDFSDKKTFRIKMCTEVNYEDFVTIHHEMGHIQYYIQYKDQPTSFRSGANPGFHEAVGDTIALSVSTPKHLKAIDLLDKNYKESEEATINAQMDMALERLAFLPFGLIVDKWRWEVFSGSVKPNEWNKRWWELRTKYQKLKSPTERQESDLDPAAKYHVIADSQYINYFIAHILEFQLYRGLCITALEYDPKNKESKPLHNCDFYNNKEVGKKLKAGLSLGLSQNWKQALKAMTGEENLSSKAILEYFEPLIKYLDQNKEHTTEELVDYIKGDYEKKASEMCTAQNNADWNYNTDITEKNNELATQQTLAYAKFEKEQYNEWFKNANADEVTDPAIKRQLKYLKVVGKAALEENKLEQYTKTVNEMSGVYSTAKICPFDNQKCDIKTQGLSLEPGIESIMSTSKNEKELLYAWSAWRDATGMKLHKQFQTYVDLSNEIGKANNFKDKGEMWRNSYDYKSDKDFVDSMDKLWTEVEPLYNKLHGYVREILLKKYGKEVMGDDNLIPAHLLGNMWGQSWINLADLTRPYPSASKIDVTKALQEQKYTVEKMFEKSNEFYMSLGLPTNEMSYGKDAMIVKPQDREVLCHASAWDFCDKKTYRIKMCTEVNYEDFITIHHEMGHIQYFIQYKNQSISFRDGANPGFHEAVGDTIALSVSTPKHLKAIELLDKNYKESEEATINAQMDMALERLAFLPFGLIVDKWRWEVFSGDVKPDKWNKRWWELRSKYQKLKPPTDRPEINLDPASKYHVVGDSQYINYFVAHILEFQLYRGLCITAGEYDPNNKESKPLHNCDFYKNQEVGKKLKAGLSLGLSQNWKEALKAMTGEEDLSSKAILEYFEPLIKYLDQDKEHSTEELVEYIKGDYEKKASEMCTAQNNADWNYNTDITEKNNELATQQTLAYAKFEKEQYNEWFKNANADEVTDPAIKRQLKYLKVVGKAALEENKLEQYTKTVNEMSGVYSTAKICPFDNQKCDIKTEGLSLEPGIESIMSTSKNEKELLYAWSAWRDATGMNLRKQFQTYVDLSNEIGKANNFKDKGEMWRSSYDYKSDKDFVDSMDKLWTKVQPLYNKLHRYVRQKLMDKHGKNVMGDDDLIPAHLLGNMWGQSWINLAELTRPYPSASKIDVTKALQEKEYTVEKMFEKSNEFYMSLGLPTNEMSYGKDAMIVKPQDREVLCHASAWDFCDKKTYRIKMCTEVNYEDFITIHHEMGHIQYFIQYKNQPISFRDGANPGFHEAVGDTIALSVSTPKHLKAIELLDENYKESEEATINAQMDMALERLAFLPFGLIVDKWRWEVFSGDVKPDKWNNRWWELRSKYQKLKPPTDRSEKYLDPAAKYHVVGDSQYINYFVAHILEFQLYRGLCITAGEYDPNNKKSKPLHNCDFYKNQEVGKKLKAGLSLGLSQNWKEALKAMTGEEDLSADAILEYFEPLDNYLTKILKNGSSPIGSTFSVCLLSLLLVLFR